MAKRNGFTLIEVLITTLILVTGLAAVAGVFSYSSLRASRVLQETAAIALMTARMEELTAAEEILPGRYFEYLVLTPGGAVIVSEPGTATWQRTWEISPEMPHRITVTVYGKSSGRTGPFREVARATTQRGRF
jgi:prepilin-type N-terminal cleavage/methylation domain-containing protein